MAGEINLDLVKLGNDEPSKVDKLDRELFATGLAKVISFCEPPLVIGIYGSWGMGKTTLMNLIKEDIDSLNDNYITVWFDPWLHQYDNNPSIALLHSLFSESSKKDDKIKKILMTVTLVLSSFFLDKFKFSSIDDVKKFGEMYEEEQFTYRDKQSLLMSKISQLIDHITENGKRKLVVFIDDLDRCMPDKAIKILETIKLYLNHPSCVYVIGVDKKVLEAGIKEQYRRMDLNETEYLDKIIQLPFFIPQISKDVIRKYISGFLPENYMDVLETLSHGLIGNPRNIKRFIYLYLLNCSFGFEKIENFEIKIMAVILIIQYREPELFALLSKYNLEKFREYVNSSDLDRDLLEVIMSVDYENINNLSKYLHLSNTTYLPNLKYYIYILSYKGSKSKFITKLVDVLGIDIAEVKNIIESLPSRIDIGLSRFEVEELKRKLVTAGASVEIRDN